MFEARYTISYRVRRGHADLSEASLQLGDLEDAIGVLVDLLEELRQLLQLCVQCPARDDHDTNYTIRVSQQKAGYAYAAVTRVPDSATAPAALWREISATSSATPNYATPVAEGVA